MLLGAYGFQCRCDACALDDALVEKEDQLRREVMFSWIRGETVVGETAVRENGCKGKRL